MDSTTQQSQVATPVTMHTKYLAGRDIIAPEAKRVGRIHTGPTTTIKGKRVEIHQYFSEVRDRSILDEVEQSLERPDYSLKEKKQNQDKYQGQQMRILHLSDIHLETESQARKYRVQLEADLVKELNVNQLEYLVISGDIAIYSTPDEYEAALELVDGLVRRFRLDSSRVVIVPGNHDLNWDLSAEAYTYVPKHKMPSQLTEGLFIPVGSAGALLRNEDLYKQRFANFSAHFYKKIYGDRPYPLDYDEQGILHPCPDNHILFLALNSCWEIDHHYHQRAGINTDALARALDRLIDGKYDDWLKVAVWHHPVTGREAMNDEFLQQLTVHGFKICLHGHIHEAIEGYHKYDDKRGICIVGAGTFGAPAREQVTGIPLQYNLLVLNPERGTVVVETRKKEKPDGAWSADARWGDKNNPVSRYMIELK